MDLEQEAVIKVNTETSGDIAEKCNKLLDLQKQMNKCQEHLKSLQEEERLLSEQEIPNLMQQAGITMLKLADGSSVEIKPFYAAKIPVSKTDEAFKWLSDNGHGDLIKNQVSLTFGKSEDNVANSLVEDLKNKGHNVSQKKKVEPMTLKGFVREQIQNGQSLPMDLFGVYVSNKTTIKK
jgi:DNA-binding protein H-NS